MTEPSEATEGCLVRLRSIYDDLKEAERRAADYILAQPGDIINLPIGEVAERSGASEATVFRLCRRLGFSGFQAMKITLAKDLVEPLAAIHEEIIETDTAGRVTQKVFQSSIQTLMETLRVLSPEVMEQATAVLAGARRLEFYGVGGSGAIAQDAMHKFLRTGIDCVAYTDPHLQVMGASLLGPADVAVGISHSGSSKDVIQALGVARRAGAKTIGITNHMRSPMVKTVDLCLFTASRETIFRSEAMSSRLAQLAILDSLFVAVSLARKEAALEAVQRIRQAIALKRY
jgi:DNA-binding MurR/RpiR family transcriptional regulator